MTRVLPNFKKSVEKYDPVDNWKISKRDRYLYGTKKVITPVSDEVSIEISIENNENYSKIDKNIDTKIIHLCTSNQCTKALYENGLCKLHYKEENVDILCCEDKCMKEIYLSGAVRCKKHQNKYMLRMRDDYYEIEFKN